MSEKHTPGPWHSSGRVVIAEDGSMVGKAATGYERDIEECEANARLIAAAPELLAALKAIMWRAEIHAARIQDSELYERALTEIRAARAAIAKAEGRS